MSNCPTVDRLAFFTTDADYLVPTLVAARQVAAQASVRDLAHVSVFLIDIQDRTQDELSRLFPDLRFITLKSEAFALPVTSTFNRTHVPRSALARLVVGKMIDSQYKHLTYFDGDIQVVGNIEPLLHFTVPPGFVLAAPDIAEIVAPEIGRFAGEFRRYRQALGIGDATDYFNSGILAATRETWVHMGEAAFTFMAEYSDLCKFHDQSALNKIFHGRRIALSPRYNLNSWLQALLPELAAQAAILHFTGGEKPWSDRANRPESRFRSSYCQLVREYPMLQSFWSGTSGRNPGEGKRDAKPLSRLLSNLRSRTRRQRARALLSSERFQLSGE